MTVIKYAQAAAQNAYLTLGLAKVCDLELNHSVATAAIVGLGAPEGLYEWAFMIYAVSHLLSVVRKFAQSTAQLAESVAMTDLPNHADVHLSLSGR